MISKTSRQRQVFTLRDAVSVDAGATTTGATTELTPEIERVRFIAKGATNNVSMVISASADNVIWVPVLTVSAGVTITGVVDPIIAPYVKAVVTNAHSSAQTVTIFLITEGY